MCRTPDDVKFFGRAKPETENDQLARWKANRKLWVEALRGGAYEQGKEFLRSDDDKFCCLGVLSDIAGCRWERSPVGAGYVADSNYDVAPSRAVEFVGLFLCNGEFERTSLAKLNDAGKTFADLANIIESEPDGLFRDASISRSDS